MKIATEKLIDAIEAINLIPSRAGISSSEFIKITCSKYKPQIPQRVKFSMASEIYGQTKARGTEPSEVDRKGWFFFVDRSNFVPFVMAAQEMGQKAPFELDLLEDKLSIKCGFRKAVFNKVTEIGGYEHEEDLQGAAELLLTREQKSMLRLATKYATGDPTCAHLNCVYMDFKGKAILASNDLAAFSLADNIVPASIPLPLLLLTIFDSDKVKSITVSKKFSKIDIGCGFLCQLTNQKAAEDFPVKQLQANLKIARAYPKRFTIKASSLMVVIKRLESYISVVVKREMTVKLIGKIGDTKIRFVCQVPQGKFEERVKLAEPLTTDVTCEWLMQLLLPLADIADTIGDIDVCYEDVDTKPVYFSASGMELLVARRA